MDNRKSQEIPSEENKESENKESKEGAAQQLKANPKSQKKKKKNKEASLQTAKGTCYVLIPLPSANRKECSWKTSNYIQKEGCDNDDLLSKKNFNELQELGNSLLNRLKNKKERKVHEDLLTFADKNILSELTENDVLYITAHGAVDSIGNSKTGIDLPPKQLGENLIAASTNSYGKTCDIGTIKIMACNSALNKSNQGVYVTEEQKKQRPKKIFDCSYIEHFKLAVNTFNKLKVVAGYLGYISDITKSKKKVDINSVVRFDNSFSALLRAKDARIFIPSERISAEKQEEYEDKNREIVEQLEYIHRLSKK